MHSPTCRELRPVSRRFRGYSMSPHCWERVRWLCGKRFLLCLVDWNALAPLQWNSRDRHLEDCARLRKSLSCCQKRICLSRAKPVQNILDLLKCPLGLRRRSNSSAILSCLLIVCLFRGDPALPTILITETSGPILRFRTFPNACHGNNNTNNIRLHPRLFIKTYSPLKCL
jgi:hypothetical protein